MGKCTAPLITTQNDMADTPKRILKKHRGKEGLEVKISATVRRLNRARKAKKRLNRRN